jgi:hypothetical protein
MGSRNCGQRSKNAHGDPATVQSGEPFAVKAQRWLAGCVRERSENRSALQGQQSPKGAVDFARPVKRRKRSRSRAARPMRTRAVARGARPRNHKLLVFSLAAKKIRMLPILPTEASAGFAGALPPLPMRRSSAGLDNDRRKVAQGSRVIGRALDRKERRFNR